MGTKTTVKTNETQSNAPPEWSQPGLEYIGQRVQDILPTVNPANLYQGGFVAQPTQYDLAAPGMYAGSANLANALTLPALGNLATAGGGMSFDQYGGPNMGGFEGFQGYQQPQVNTSNYGGFNGYTAPTAGAVPGLQFGGFGGPDLGLSFAGSPSAGGGVGGGSSFDASSLASSASFDPAQLGTTAFTGYGGPEARTFADYDATAINPVIAAATAPILRNLTESILPSLSSSAIQSGGYGSSRMQNVLPSMTMAQVARDAQELGLGIAHNDFLQGENRALQSFQLGTERGLGQLAANTGAYNASTQRGLGQGQLANQAYGLSTERGLGQTANEIAASNANTNAFSAFTDRTLGAGNLNLGGFQAGTQRGLGVLDALNAGQGMGIDAYRAGTERGLGEQNIGLGYSAQGLDAFGQGTQRGASELDAMIRANQLGLQGYGAATERGIGGYNATTGRTQSIPDLLQSIMQLNTGAADLTAGAGQLARQNEQLGIEDALARFDYGSRAPFAGLDIAANLLGAIGNPWGTRTTQGTQTQSSGGLGQILQGAMGLGSMALGFPGFSSLFKPAAAGG